MKKVALLIVIAAGGCASTREIPDRPGYPAAVGLGAPLDIQVARDGTRIHLTNTTARSFGEGVLWLNRWYSQKLKPLAAGEARVLNLSDFEDQYGDRFRAGGFFAIERPERLAVAELETTGESGARVLLPLVVVGELER